MWRLDQNSCVLGCARRIPALSWNHPVLSSSYRLSRRTPSIEIDRRTLIHVRWRLVAFVTSTIVRANSIERHYSPLFLFPEKFNVLLLLLVLLRARHLNGTCAGSNAQWTIFEDGSYRTNRDVCLKTKIFRPHGPIYDVRLVLYFQRLFQGRSFVCKTSF